MKCNCFVGYNKISTEEGIFLDLVSKSMLGKSAEYDFNFCPLCGKSLLDEEIDKKTNIEVDYTELKDIINEIFRNFENGENDEDTNWTCE